MAGNEGLGHLELLVALCRQLPGGEGDRLLELDVEDDPLFAPAVLAAHESGRIRLSAVQVNLLRVGLRTHRLAV